MEISIANRQRRIGIRSNCARSIASSVLERESACFDEISIVFLGDSAMQRVNRAFMGRDESTDTLAFELTPEMARQKPVSGIRLGEVIVCMDRAISQSKRYRVSLGKEVARLLIHGLLHLCGFEDGTKNDRARMHRRENLYITSLGKLISSFIISPHEASTARSPTARGPSAVASKRKGSVSKSSKRRGAGKGQGARKEQGARKTRGARNRRGSLR
jgi:probable rRNA maturation factor